MALESYCFIPSFKVNGLSILEKKIFDRFLPYTGMAATLVMWPSSFEQTFIHPIQRSSASSLALIGPAASEQKMFERWISVNLRQRSNNYLDLCFQEHVCRLYVHILDSKFDLALKKVKVNLKDQYFKKFCRAWVPDAVYQVPKSAACWFWRRRLLNGFYNIWAWQPSWYW